MMMMMMRMVMHKLQLSLPDQLARFTVLLLVHRAFLGKLPEGAEQELHRLLAALLILIGSGRFLHSHYCSISHGHLFLLVGLVNAARNHCLHIVLHPRQVIQLSPEVIDGGLLVKLLVLSKLKKAIELVIR